MVLSVYQCYYIQVRYCAVEDYCYAGMYWYLEHIEDVYNSSRPRQMVLSRFWVSMTTIHDELDDIVQ